MDQIIFTSNTSPAASDNAVCSRCGGTKPTCCRCPDPVPLVRNRLAEEFAMAAIEAHVGYQHKANWRDCDYAKCVERREMIESLQTLQVALADAEQLVRLREAATSAGTLLQEVAQHAHAFVSSWGRQRIEAAATALALALDPPL